MIRMLFVDYFDIVRGLPNHFLSARVVGTVRNSAPFCSLKLATETKVPNEGPEVYPNRD